LKASYSRRDWLRNVTAAAAAVPLHPIERFLSAPQAADSAGQNQPQLPIVTLPENVFPRDPSEYRFRPDEETFLEDVERTSFTFFWEQGDPTTGLVKDRNLADGPDQRNVASIAACGFGLSALCIADQRRWEDSDKLIERVRNTLRFAAHKLPHQRGFFYHFMNMRTGERALQSEVSPIDSTIFLCGMMHCKAYFDDKEIRELATQIFNRVDWNWMLHGGKTLALGWLPERGFLGSRWDSYSELMMMYLLGMASPTHPIPPASWLAWTRPNFDFNNIYYIGAHAPLFVHQFSHAWFDFRGKHDKYCNYFVNSTIATKVHKMWCLEIARQFPGYSEDLWGITASDSSHGYRIWGGPPPMGPIDGTIVPCAAGGSLPFMPLETLRVLQNIQENFGNQAWKRYGFVDAFNPLSNWYSPDVIGIDLGITMLMAENARTGFVWKYFMQNEEVQRGMKKAAFIPDSGAEG